MYRYLIAATVFGIAVLAGCGTGDESMLRKEIWESIEREDLESIKQYANSRGNLNTSQLFHPQNNLLIYAMENESFEAFELLLGLGSDPNAQSRSGQTAMHVAALKNDSKWLSALLSHGGDPNLKNNTGWKSRGTVLFYAATSRNPEDMAELNPSSLALVQLLVAKGADVNVRCNEVYPEETAISAAAGRHNFDVVLYLLEQGAGYGECVEPLHTGLMSWMCNFAPSTFYDLETRNQYLKVREFIERDARSRHDTDIIRLLYQMQRQNKESK